MKNVDLAFVEDLGLPIAFPTSYFPGAIELYRQDLMSKTTIPGEFAAAGMLAALSVGVGNSVVGRLGTKRFIPASLFLLLIGNPGSGKSPALINTMEAIRREQAARVQAALQPAGACLQLHISGGGCNDPMGLGGNDGFDDGCDQDDDAGETAPSPVRHLYLTDATVPGVREALLNNPRGIVVAADEAVSLFKGAGKSTDRGIWLQIWNAENITVSRRSGKPPIITIPRSFVTLVAGTQPDIFPQLRNTHGDDGLLDRIMTFGDKTDGWPGYSHCRTDAALAAAYNGAVDRLLQHRDDASADVTGAALVLPITDACSRIFEECHNRITGVFDRVHAARRYGGLITKTIANAQRLAVLRACSRWATDSAATAASPSDVTVADAAEACRVAEFSLGRAILWRPELVGSAPTTIAVPPIGRTTSSPAAVPAAGTIGDLPQQILDYMARRGLREVQIRKLRSCGSFGSASSVELRMACDALDDAGRGQWRDTRKGLFGLLFDFSAVGGADNTETSVGENGGSR